MTPGLNPERPPAPYRELPPADSAWQTSSRDLLTVLFRRRWGVFAIIGMCMLGVMFWMFFIRQDTYDTTAKVLVKIGHEQANGSTLGRPAMMITGDRTQDVNSEAEIIQSTDLLEKLIRHFDLDKPKAPKPPPQRFLPRVRYEVRLLISEIREWKDALMIRAGLKEELTPHEKTLTGLRRALLVVPERNSNILTVHLAVEQREYGAPLLNKLLDLYQAFRLQVYRERGAPEFFRTEARQTGGRLRGAEQQLRAFEEQWNISAIQKQKEVLLDQIAAEQAAVNSAHIDVRDIAVKAERAEKQSNAEEPDFAAIGAFPANTFPEAVLQQLASLQAERERLRMTELDSGERIRNNRDQFRVALGMVTGHLRSMQADKEAAAEKRAQVLAGLQSEIRALQDKEGEWNALKRRVKMLEDSYMGYQKRFEETAATSVMGERNIGNVTVVQHAVDPTEPGGISKIRLLGLAFLLSVVAAMAWLGAAEFLDHRIYSADQLRQHLRAPVLEVIPALRPGRAAQMGDSYRKAAGLLARNFGGGEPRALLFSSADHGEGTTTAVLSVAEYLNSRYGLRPLVIELDRAHPTLIKRFHLDANRTIDAFASGAVSALHCVQRNGSGVSYVPALKTSRNGHVAPSHIRALIREVQPNFDVVLVDAPPIGDPDTLTVAGLVKNVVLVVESGRTRYESLARARQDLAGEDAVIAGAVLNKQKYFIPRWIYRWLVE